MKYVAAFISNILLSVFVSVVVSRNLLLACSPVWFWSGFDAGLLLEFSKINRKPEFFLVVGRHVTRKVITVGHGSDSPCWVLISLSHSMLSH